MEYIANLRQIVDITYKYFDDIFSVLSGNLTTEKVYDKNIAQPKESEHREILNENSVL